MVILKITPQSYRTSVQFSHCRVQLFETPWTVAGQASLSNTSSRSLLKAMSIELVMPSNHLIFCRPLLLLPSIFPRVFSNESALHIRCLKYWSFNLSISPSSEYSELIYFRTDWFDLLAVQGALKSLGLSFEDHSSFLSAVTICSHFGALENKVCHCFHCFPTYLTWSDGTGCYDLSF